MRARRPLALTLLFLTALLLPTKPAPAQSPKGDKDIPAPRRVVDPKEVEDLKKALADLKAKTDADAKALSAKLEEASKAAGAAADTKSMGEKVSAIEKSTSDISTIKGEVFDSSGASKITVARQRGDTAWMLTASAFVMFMVPGLALFYGGMVRRKNVLATMMQSMAALAVVGVYWIVIGYSLAFGPSAIKVDLFGVKDGGLIGWSSDLAFLKGIEATTYLGGYDVPVYVHVMFQGMFAIITPALISGAIAERIRFWPFCLFMVLWVTFVYCPLAHMVWAFDWFDASVPSAKQGVSAIGLLGKMGALDFAGGTVVHIAAGMAGLACCLVLGKRAGYPKMVAHPNSMVLTLLGAAMLWFGWFGFNGGSSVRADNLAGSAFAATQAAAAAAGLGWMVVEWIHKGKPTALGIASGIVAGLVAVTPASGFVYMWGGVCIGLAAAVICYLAVALKSRLGYDDSLDAFGVHAVGGFVGAVLTGVFCSALIQSASADGPFAYSAHRSKLESLKKDSGKAIKEAKEAAEKADAAAKEKEKELSPQIETLTKAKDDAEKMFNEAEVGKRDVFVKALAETKEKLKEVTDELDKLKDEAAVKAAAVATMESDLKTLQALADKQDADGKSAASQVWIQLKAAVFSVLFAFVLSLGLCALTHATTGGNFKTDEKGESLGLDRTEHDEVGFDFSAATESVAVVSAEPRPASVPRGNGRFDLKVTGADSGQLMKAWSALAQPTEGPADPDFLAVYPYVTTIRGTTFRCRGGDQDEVAKRLATLFKKHLGKEVSVAKV
jgi:ammonium transporter, Amt family